MISNKEILEALHFEIERAYIDKDLIFLIVKSPINYYIKFYWYEYESDGKIENTLEVSIIQNNDYGDTIYRMDIDKNIETEVKYWVKKRATDWIQHKLNDIFLPTNMFDKLIHD